MLGPVPAVDPPPGSALRMLVVTFQWPGACSRGTAVRLTATGSPDPSVDGDGHGQLPRAGYPVSWGSRAVWAPALRFRTSTSQIVLPKVFFEPRPALQSGCPSPGSQDQAAYCLGGSRPQTKAPHLTNDLISMGPNPSTRRPSMPH